MVGMRYHFLQKQILKHIKDAAWDNRLCGSVPHKLLDIILFLVIIFMTETNVITRKQGLSDIILESEGIESTVDSICAEALEIMVQ